MAPVSVDRDWLRGHVRTVRRPIAKRGLRSTLELAWNETTFGICPAHEYDLSIDASRANTYRLGVQTHL